LQSISKVLGLRCSVMSFERSFICFIKLSC
jgi:hypothetical protein